MKNAAFISKLSRSCLLHLISFQNMGFTNLKILEKNNIHSLILFWCKKVPFTAVVLPP